MTAEGRIGARFRALKAAGRRGLVSFITAGDPDTETSARILRRLPASGADLIELGMPFSDPMADGPAIQAASQRALAAGQTVRRTLDMVADFRRGDDATPIILMGYYNPIYVRGIDNFVAEAKAAGVDGLIVVDLPAEEAHELAPIARTAGIDLVPLVAPTTGDDRLPLVLRETGGFVYYISVTGITGTTSAVVTDVAAAVNRIRRHTHLPVAIGFGIRTPDQAATMAAVADGVVVGSALVSVIADNLDSQGHAKPGLEDAVCDLVGRLAKGVNGGAVKGAAE